MKKTKIILAALGGCALLGLLIVGWLLFSAFSKKSELLEDLRMREDKMTQLRSAKIAPTAVALRQLVTNKTMVASWLAATREEVAAGDQMPDLNQTEAAFKSKMIEDARQLSALPGSAAGKLVKENFGFGYNDFITGGKMPTKAELPELQCRWSDVVTLVKIFASSGAREIVEVASLATEAPKPETTARSNKRTPKRTKVEDSAETAKIVRRSYEFKLRVDSVALVRILNACASDSRFIVVDSLNFARAEDEIANRIGESNKSSQKVAGRGRRRGAQAIEFVEATAKEESRKGLVIDPATVSPFAVTLRVTTIDFGSKQPSNEKEATK